MSFLGDDLSGLSERLEALYEVLAGDHADDDSLGDWAAGSIVTTMLPLLAVLSVLQMVSGSVLETFEETLLVYPSLLVLVPVQIGTAGNLASIMCARLSTQFHLGTFELHPSNPDVRANVVAVLALAFTIFSLVGVAAWAIGRVLGGSLALAEVFAISMLSGLGLALLVISLSLLSVTLSFRLGYDPDDTTIPIVTNVCDIVGVLLLFAVATLVL